MAVDEGKLMEFLGTFVGDLGATISAGSVVLGDRLGLYRALAEGPATPEQLGARTGTDARYVTEWLRGQAVGGYVTYDPAGDIYSMSEEQAFALTDPDGPVYLPGAFQLAPGALRAVPRISEGFRTGPGYLANLESSWIPALDGVQDKLKAGAKVADVGCGHGASTALMAQSYLALLRRNGDRDVRSGVSRQAQRPCIVGEAGGEVAQGDPAQDHRFPRVHNRHHYRRLHDHRRPVRL